MKHHPNPYDEEYDAPVTRDATMDASAMHLAFPDPLDDCDRRDQTDAGRLRRAAYAAERSGYTSLAILYRNSAWVAERGHSWLDYMHAQARGMLDGRTDDVTVKN